MAWQVSKRVWDNCPSKIAKNDRLMLLALAERADEHGVCWPGYSALAKMCGVSERSAMRLIEFLEDSGQIVVLRQMGMSGGRGYTNVYFVTTGLTQEAINYTLTSHFMLKKGDNLDTLNGLEKGDNLDKKGDNLDKKGDIAVSPEPSIEPSYKPSINTQRATRPKPEPIPAVKVHVEVTGKYLLNTAQIKEVAEVVGDSPNSLEKWRDSVKAWVMHGNKPTNISGQLDWFRDGIPVYKNGGSSNGNHSSQPNRPAQGRPAPGHRTDAGQQGDDSGGIPAQVAAAFKRISRASGSGA